jgi:uncharacterized protein GlcG (DUF336 family)
MAHPANPQLPQAYGLPIDVETARRVAAAAIACAHRQGWTVAVAIVDPGGDLVFFERIDHTQAAGSKIAQEKARTAVRFKRATKLFEDAVSSGRHAILGLPDVTPLEGGIPLIVDGAIIGAIGVSGVTSQQDGVCAQAGVDALAAAAAASPS